MTKAGPLLLGWKSAPVWCMLFGPFSKPLFSPGAAKAAPCSLQEEEEEGVRVPGLDTPASRGCVGRSAVMQAWPALGGLAHTASCGTEEQELRAE